MSVLKLWLIEQDEKGGYDTYDCAVVAAMTEDDAKHIHPSGEPEKNWTDAMEDADVLDSWRYGTWANHPDNVKATVIGDAHASVSAGDVLCASFNAG
jgi:homoserine kinase